MRVEKWHGSGNDFLVADARGMHTNVEWQEWVRRYCDRHRGVGADGVLIVEPSERADFHMRYHNADGGEAGMCGNGGRVIAAFAGELGDGGSGVVNFTSLWGKHRAVVSKVSEYLFSVRLELPEISRPRALEVEAPWGGISALHVQCGVPHLVLPLSTTPAKSMGEVNVSDWGAALRGRSELGQAGANIDFINLAKDGSIVLRTYERGVEAETLSCGTGATAAAAAAHFLGWSKSPVQVRPWSGDVLEVSYGAEPESLCGLVLQGPAEKICRIELPSP